jgi:uncharacterized UBP type Zn finger protein
MKTDGLKEEMPGGVCLLTIQYGCENCRHATKQYHTCQVNQMLPVILLMQGHRSCMFRNMTVEQIEKEINAIKHERADSSSDNKRDTLPSAGS